MANWLISQNRITEDKTAELLRSKKGESSRIYIGNWGLNDKIQSLEDITFERLWRVKKSQGIYALYQFRNEIKVGDYIIVSASRRHIYWIGKVVEEAKVTSDEIVMDWPDDVSFYVTIEWELKPDSGLFLLPVNKQITKFRRTLCELSDDDYLRYREDILNAGIRARLSIDDLQSIEESKATESSDVEFESLKVDLERIKLDYRRASQILRDIWDYQEKFEKLKDALSDENEWLEAGIKWSKVKRGEISQLNDEVKTLREEIAASLEKTKENISNMQQAYVEFSELKWNVQGRTEEIGSLLSAAKGLRDDIERTKLLSQKSFEDIGRILVDIQGKTQEMQQAYEGFLGIKSKIDDENTGLNAILKLTNSLKEKSEKLTDNISAFRDEAGNLLEGIKDAKIRSDAHKKAIDENLDATNKLKAQVAEVTNLITDTGFVNAFKTRADLLQKSHEFWMQAIMASAILLLIILLVMFAWESAVPDSKLVLFRLSLTSPLIFFIWFAVKQYSKDRNLNEKYAFKTATATVIRNHVQFLGESFGHKNWDLSKFIIGTFTTLYKEPYLDDGEGEKVKKCNEAENDKNQNATTKLPELEKQDPFDVKQAVELVKELKTIVPDNDTLAKIMSLFAWK